MPLKNPEAYKTNQKDPLGEYAGVGEPEHLNDAGKAPFKGVEGMADPRRETGASAGEGFSQGSSAGVGRGCHGKPRSRRRRSPRHGSARWHTGQRSTIPPSP